MDFTVGSSPYDSSQTILQLLECSLFLDWLDTEIT
jgi:hypothetical protein